MNRKRRKFWQSFDLQGQTPQQAKAAAQVKIDVQGGTFWMAPSFFDEVPKREPLAKHLVVGPTHGYRLWPVYTNQHGDLWLGSMGVIAEPWQMGSPTKARCHSDRLFSWSESSGHEAPGETCDCGIYAVNDLRHLDLYREPVERKDGTCIAVAAGRVALWGRVYEHEKGFRAQYAYPAALWPFQVAPLPQGFPQPRRWLEVFLRLGETYGVPIFPEAA